jgi:hypothetical protein
MESKMSKEIYTEIIQKVMENSYPDQLKCGSVQFKSSYEIPGIPHVVPWILIRSIKRVDLSSSISHKLYYRDCNGLVHLAYEQTKNVEHNFTARGNHVSTVAHTNVIVSPKQIFKNAEQNYLSEQNQHLKASLKDALERLDRISKISSDR